MSAFSRRTSGYKGGVFLLFLAAVVFLIGYGSPYWAKVGLKYDSSTVTVSYYEGLFMYCIITEVSTISVTGCFSMGFANLEGWFHAVRALDCVCALGLIIACIYCIATNCCRTFPGPRSRFLEAMAAIAGLLGFIGCMVFVGISTPQKSLARFLAALLMDDQWTFTWAFYMASIGSALSVVAAIIIAICNKPVEQLPHSGGLVMTTIAQPVAYPAAYPAAHPAAYPPPQPAAYPATNSHAGYAINKAGYPAPC